MELGFLFGVGFAIARPRCPPGQLGLSHQIACMALAVLDIVFAGDIVEEKLRRPSLLIVTQFGRWVLEHLFEVLTLICGEF